MNRTARWLMGFLAVSVVAVAAAPFERQRTRMVEQQLVARGITDPAALQAMRAVPRHEFVPANLQHAAYDDGPLPIGEGQTISQPYIVGLMTELMALKKTDRVLEIGTGSGYQAAVLAEVAGEVYTIEIVEWLARTAAERLQRLGYDKVRVRFGDGYHGWPEHAPFDAIMITAAAPEIPPALLEQLKPGGRLVMPLGPVGDSQELVVITKNADGTGHARRIARVRFVPFTRSPE